MSHKVFRIANLVWVVLMGVCFGLGLEDATTPAAVIGMSFWGVYVLASMGVFFDLRLAWLLCAAQLVTVWLLMGAMVSDRSFFIFTGQSPFKQSSHAIHMVVFNSFFGVIAPASGLMIALFFARRHLVWVFFRRRLEKRRRRSGAASRPGAVTVWNVEPSSRID